MISLVLAALLPVLPARADWEASFTAQSSTNSFPKATGKFYSRIDQFRVDTNVPFEMSLYAKAGANQVFAAVHSFRIRLSTKLEKVSAQVPACLSRPFEECVRKYALKKTGEAPCGDAAAPRTCEVYVGGGGGTKGVKKIEVKHWKGEKEPILASSVITKSDGEVITTRFSKISRKARDAAFYSVPSGYVNAGSLEKFFGDFRGKSE